MKKIIACLLLSMTLTSFAATVKVTSFYFVRNSDNIAELCGVVEGATKTPSFVRLNIDYKGQRPGVYVAVTDGAGRFCHTVVSYRGEADLSLVDDESNSITTTLVK